MRHPTVRVLAAAALLTASSAVSPRPAALPFPDDDKTIVHVLNRIGFGPRPGDVARVRDLGLQRYLDEQLRPGRPADPAVETRLAGLTTLRMSNEEIRNAFERPQREARRTRQMAAPGAGDGQPPPPSPEMRRPDNRLLTELSGQKVLRAIYSERQLEEVLTDFWFNHFNVDARKGRDRFFLTAYERDAIRPHVLGRFRDLLEATAKSPAMLFYLDNWMSVDPDAAPRRGRGNPAAGNNPRRGLNENYGRELLELHTLGVDGGYTQNDVREVARAFTGWTIGGGRQGADYRFDARLHDRGEKLVLGHRIAAGGGERDGEQVLDLLAAHPSTARFIATKLVRRFVSDTPPAALVDRVTARYTATGGDIRELVRTIVTSPEFLAPDAHRAKVKTPFEFVVSAVRATGAEVEDAAPLVRALQQLGMPLYACQPPTGYTDTADGWVNTGALVARMNIALAMASERMRGVTLASGRSTGAGAQATGGDPLLGSVLHGDVSEATRATIARAPNDAYRMALALGSPEFQKR